LKAAYKTAVRFALGATVCVLAGTAAMARAQVSLRTVVDLAQRNSTAVRVAQADLERARAVFAESREVFIPSLSVSTGLPAFPAKGFTGQPPSIWGGTVQSLVFSIPQKYYIGAGRAGMQAAEVRLRDAREQVALDASDIYIELDTVHRELEMAGEQEGFAARMLEIEQQRAEAGVASLRDLLDARLTLANVRLARIRMEARTGTLAQQLAELTGLPAGSIAPDHASIPQIPEVRGDVKARTPARLDAAHLIAVSKERQAQGDEEVNFIPQLTFYAQYNRNTTLLNDVNHFFANALPANNFSSGFSIQIPLFDMEHRAKGRESRAEALRATVEAEEARRQNDLEIARLNGSLRELDALAEVAKLKQEIAAEDVKTVQAELENGNGAGTAPGAPQQLSPKAEQLARINEHQKQEEAEEAALELAKARLGLLRVLGHMQDWLDEVLGK
jgi:outer membrane protein TolC